MPPEADLAVAISKIESLSDDMADIKTSMRELALAVSRLAVVEERQATTNEAMGRLFKAIEALDTRVKTLEQAQPLQQQSSDWVQAGIKYIVAAVLGAILAGFMRGAPTVPPMNPPALTSK